MAALSSLLLASSASQGIAAVGTGISQSQASLAQGEYQQRMYETNARMAEYQAQDAVKRGDQAAKAHDKQVKGVIGSQRAAMAAQGVEVDSGSALDLQTDTAAIGAQDSLTIKNNAWREAWGYKVQANEYQGKGAMAGISSRFEAKNSILTGGMKALGYGLEGAYYGQGGGKNKKG
jgi:hypothetical protein